MITTNYKSDRVLTDRVLMVFMIAVLLASSAYAAGLKITEVDFDVEYDEAYTYRIENRDRIDTASISNNSKINADVLPGSNITFTIRVENTYPNNGPELRGVFSRVIIEDIDDGADLEEESLDFDLEPGDDYRFDVTFQVPLDVEAGTYNTIIESEGEDKNETLHETRITAKLEIKKQSHDIRITKASLEPSAVKCDRKIMIVADAMNLGSNPESQVALEFKSPSLGISTIDKDRFLQSSDEAAIDEKTYTKTLTATIPKSAEAGVYNIDINLYWRNVVLFDKKTLGLSVKDCETAQSAGETEGAEITEEQVAENIGNNAESGTTQLPAESKPAALKSLNSPALMLIILIGFAAFVIAIVAIFGYSRRKV